MTLMIWSKLLSASIMKEILRKAVPFPQSQGKSNCLQLTLPKAQRLLLAQPLKVSCPFPLCVSYTCTFSPCPLNSSHFVTSYLDSQWCLADVGHRMWPFEWHEFAIWMSTGANQPSQGAYRRGNWPVSSKRQYAIDHSTVQDSQQRSRDYCYMASPFLSVLQSFILL